MLSPLLSARLALLSAALLLPCTPSQTAAQTRSEYAAVVGPAEATFTFPVPARAEWSWNDPATRAGRIEYHWGITVADADRRYRLAYLLARLPGSPPARGDLAALLAAGERSFFILTDRGGRQDAGVEVEVVAGTGRLQIRLRDRDAVERLFSSRPDSIVFHSLVAGTPADSQFVRVTYDDREAPDSTPGAGAGSKGALELGQAAPEYELPVLVPEPEGGPSLERLSSLRGEIVVLYLWFGNCPVSREEYPELVRFAGQWSQAGVRFRGIVLADTAEAREWLQQQGGAPFPQLVATEGMRRGYGSPGSPTVVVIDRDGRVAHAAFGAGQLAPEMILRRRLQRLTEERS